MTRFLESYVSFTLLAFVLTPEMTSALSILVAAVFVGLVNLYVARTSRLVAMKEVARVLAPVQAKVEEMIPVLSRVDAHVNSEKTKNEVEKTSKDQQIALQREMIEELKKAAALLAQARSASDLVAAVTAATGVASPPSSTAKILDNIDASTKAIDVNTKKTSADVKELKGQ